MMKFRKEKELKQWRSVQQNFTSNKVSDDYFPPNYVVLSRFFEENGKTLQQHEKAATLF